MATVQDVKGMTDRVLASVNDLATQQAAAFARLEALIAQGADSDALTDVVNELKDVNDQLVNLTTADEAEGQPPEGEPAPGG